MNTIQATITHIEGVDSINLVSFGVSSEKLMMISLELNPSLAVGSEVIVGFKATTVSLAKEKSEMLSISNQIPVRIIGINNGALVSSIKLSFADTVIESIITKASVIRMGLKSQDEVIALVKSSDLSIVEIL